MAAGDVPFDTLDGAHFALMAAVAASGAALDWVVVRRAPALSRRFAFMWLDERAIPLTAAVRAALTASPEDLRNAYRQDPGSRIDVAKFAGDGCVAAAGALLRHAEPERRPGWHSFGANVWITPVIDGDMLKLRARAHPWELTTTLALVAAFVLVAGVSPEILVVSGLTAAVIVIGLVIAAHEGARAVARDAFDAIESRVRSVEGRPPSSASRAADSKMEG